MARILRRYAVGLVVRSGCGLGSPGRVADRAATAGLLGSRFSW